jgi:hypothetical protein
MNVGLAKLSEECNRRLCGSDDSEVEEQRLAQFLFWPTTRRFCELLHQSWRPPI